MMERWLSEHHWVKRDGAEWIGCLVRFCLGRDEEGEMLRPWWCEECPRMH